MHNYLTFPAIVVFVEAVVTVTVTVVTVIGRLGVFVREGNAGAAVRLGIIGP